MRVAVASADGRHVQEHFGQATRSMIWEVDGGTARHVETRSAPQPASAPPSAGHDAGRLKRAVDLLGDCQAVIAARIGPGAGEMLARRGIRAFAASQTVDSALRQLIATGVLSELSGSGAMPGRRPA